MSCNEKKCCGKIITIAALVVILVLNLILLFKKDAWDLEVLKVWWKENMQAIQQIYNMDEYKTSQTEAINATLEQIWLLAGDTDTENTDIENTDNESDDTNGSEDVKTVVEDILASAPIRGDKDARFTILEYTELHCPYCQRHAQNGTIQSVLDKFPGEVNSVSRHYIIHGEGAQKLAAAMECVAELKADAYYDVFEAAFDAYPVDMDGLVEIAVNKGVNKSKLQSCVDEWKYIDAVSAMMSQWASVFGVTWTPGNVIIDRETWKFQLIPGAYPADTFIEAINNMKSAE